MENTEILNRGTSEIIVRNSLAKKLASGKKLRVKHGVDPTTDRLHLGHAVIYEKLRELQLAGHTIIFLIGDFTARFGDPSDKLKVRKMKSKEETVKLAEKYLEQVGKIINLKETEIRYNGEWYDKLTLEEFLKIKSNLTHSQLIERDLFQERLKSGNELWAHEIDYPILQGYDSVMLESDLTAIGTDQLFNELVGRRLQEVAGQPPQDIIAMRLLVGTDGKAKMSQSLGNDIGINEAPEEQYGKLMSVPDSVMLDYFELLGRLDEAEMRSVKTKFRNASNRRDLKGQLAHRIVENLHSREAADAAQEHFENVFVKKSVPTDMPTVEIAGKEIMAADLIVAAKLAESKSEARRLVLQGGVKIDDQIITDPDAKIEIKSDMVLKVGKRRFAKIKLKI